jgi:hypothetical protein
MKIYNKYASAFIYSPNNAGLCREALDAVFARCIKSSTKTQGGYVTENVLPYNFRWRISPVCMYIIMRDLIAKDVVAEFRQLLSLDVHTIGGVLLCRSLRDC